MELGPWQESTSKPGHFFRLDSSGAEVLLVRPSHTHFSWVWEYKYERHYLFGLRGDLDSAKQEAEKYATAKGGFRLPDLIKTRFDRILDL